MSGHEMTLAKLKVGQIAEMFAASDVLITAALRDIEVTSITHDSRQADKGSLFCCVHGDRYDGHSFASDAVARGASALMVDHFLPEIDSAVAQIIVTDVRSCVGAVAAKVYGNPSRQLSVVGITGTNGKTTTAHLLASILRSDQVKTEILGTLSGGFTTPEAADLQKIFADMLDVGVRAIAMEVSSHALALGRVNGTYFSQTVFTNLGIDHLDFHGTQEEYFRAKLRLFNGEFSETGIVNADDSFGQKIIEQADISITPFSMQDIHDLEVSAVEHRYTWRGHRIEVAIGGSVNVMNSIAAATTASEMGVTPQAIMEGLRDMPPISGRFEKVDVGQDFVVLVDFAHTPDGLAQVLRSVRESTPGGRVLVVFGCGGDRDKMKRPMMGEIAVSLADHVVVTSDNPRSENPETIIASVVAGIPEHLRHRLVATEVDRRLAIRRALRMAEPADVVVIAGKGHETTQTIGAEVLPFDDRLVVTEILRGVG